MSTKVTYIYIGLVLLTATTACHTRKAAGTKQEVSKNVIVPPADIRRQDTTTHTPTAKIIPDPRLNVRPKAVPEPQPPVPPM